MLPGLEIIERIRQIISWGWQEDISLGNYLAHSRLTRESLDLKCAEFVMLGGKGNPRKGSFMQMLYALTVLVNLACAWEVVSEYFIPNFITLSRH